MTHRGRSPWGGGILLVPPAEWGPDAGPARAQGWDPMRGARLSTQHLRADARSEVTTTTIVATAQGEAREAEGVHQGLGGWSWPAAEPRVARQVQRRQAASSQRTATSCPPGIRTGPGAMSVPVEAQEVSHRVIRSSAMASRSPGQPARLEVGAPAATPDQSPPRSVFTRSFDSHYVRGGRRGGYGWVARGRMQCGGEIHEAPEWILGLRGGRRGGPWRYRWGRPQPPT